MVHVASYYELLRMKYPMLFSQVFHTAQKMKISDLVTFTEKILNGKLLFLCSVNSESSFKIHDCYLHKLLIEIFKFKINLTPEIINEVFDIVECLYPLRN